jgi:hypothetical protein
VVGAGVLTLPHAVSWLGWLAGPLCLTVFFVINIWCAFMLADVYEVGAAAAMADIGRTNECTIIAAHYPSITAKHATTGLDLKCMEGSLLSQLQHPVHELLAARCCNTCSQGMASIKIV